MSERYRVEPRYKDLRGHFAYGFHWPGEGRTVTSAEVGVDTLQRLDADPGYIVERLPDETADTRNSPAHNPGRAENDKTRPKGSRKS